VESILLANDELVISPPPGKVTINGAEEYAVSPVVILVTVIGAYVAPTGTVTVRDIEEAELTDAFVAPKKTTLLPAVVLKFVPVIVTVVPIEPDAGENDVIVGCAVTIIMCNKPTSKRRQNIRKVFIVYPFMFV
jgi:hypothetical protein